MHGLTSDAKLMVQEEGTEGSNRRRQEIIHGLAEHYMMTSFATS